MRVNWLGLAAGILILIVLVLSLYIPWWQLTIGEDIIKVNASPVNTNFGLFGAGFRIPLISALNIISILTLATSGIIMLIYSLIPDRPYSKHLIGFAYRKPIYVVVGFITGLIVTIVIAGALGINVPIIGSATITLPSNLTFGTTISASAYASFQLPFWLAIFAATLSILARLHHPEAIDTG